MNRLQQYRGLAITTVIALAVGVASYAVVRSDPFGERDKTLFTLDLSKLYDVSPELIQYRQVAGLRVEGGDLRAIAVGPSDEIYVADGQGVHVLSPEGEHKLSFHTERAPTCLAVATSEHVAPGRVYVGAERKIELFSPEGEAVGAWDVPGDNLILASIAVGARDVYVADAGNRVVLRYDDTGQLLGKIGDSNGEAVANAFTVPSTYFDVAMGASKLLQVANPGMLRIESYGPEGQLDVRWGDPGFAIQDFFGCCNPSHIAVLPSGEIVTSEKGVPRIKVYSEFGEFVCAVAGPRQLDVAESELGDPRSLRAKAVFDIAADSRGRVLALDPRQKTVRVFERLGGQGDSGGASDTSDKAEAL